MSKATDLAAELDRGWAELRALRPRVEAGAPWPISDKFDSTPEAYWYPPEVLAHVADLLDRWLRTINAVVDGSPEPVAFGQLGPNPARLTAIERYRQLSIPELYDLIETNLTAARLRIAGLSDAQLAKRGRHATKGETTVEGIISGSVTGHLDEHVRQLETLLAASPA